MILEPLGDDEAGDLIDQLLGAPLDAEARELVVRHAEGNPFFVEEVLSDLIDRELLTRRQGGWALDAGALTIPDSVQGIPPAARGRCSTSSARVAGLRARWGAGVSRVDGWWAVQAEVQAWSGAFGQPPSPSSSSSTR